MYHVNEQDITTRFLATSGPVQCVFRPRPKNNPNQSWPSTQSRTVMTLGPCFEIKPMYHCLSSQQ